MLVSLPLARLSSRWYCRVYCDCCRLLPPSYVHTLLPSFIILASTHSHTFNFRTNDFRYPSNLTKLIQMMLPVQLVTYRRQHCRNHRTCYCSSSSYCCCYCYSTSSSSAACLSFRSGFMYHSCWCWSAVSGCH